MDNTGKNGERLRPKKPGDQHLGPRSILEVPNGNTTISAMKVELISR